MTRRYPLVTYQGCNVGLDASSTEANDDDCGDVPSECMASGDRRGKGSRPQNQKTNPVDSGEDQDGVVFAKILISDDGYCRVSCLHPASILTVTVAYLLEWA